MKERIRNFFDELPFKILGFIGGIRNYFVRKEMEESGYRFKKDKDSGGYTIESPTMDEINRRAKEIQKNDLLTIAGLAAFLCLILSLFFFFKL